MIKRLLFLNFFLLYFSSCNKICNYSDCYVIKSPSVSWQYKGAEMVCLPKVEIPKEIKEGDVLSLAELLDIGLSYTPTTKKTWYEAKEAAYLFGVALSEYYPKLGFYGSATRERQTFFNETLPPGVSKSTPYYRTIITADLRLSYLIYDFGKRKNTSEMARYSLFYANFSHNFALQDVIKTIMSDYYDLQFRKEFLKATTKDLADAETSLDAAKNKFTTGVANTDDVAQAETKYLQTLINLNDRKKELEASFAKLVNDIGLPANLTFETENFPKKIVPEEIPQTLEELIDIAEKKRPDFLAMQSEVRKNEENLKRAKAALYPTLDAYFDIGKNYYNDDEKEDYHFTATLNLSFPIFEGFAHKNLIKKAEAKLETAKSSLLQKKLAIVEQVKTSHFNVKTAAKILIYSQKYLKAARIRFDVALGNYKSGTSTILDLTSALSDLADARARLAKAKKDWFFSLAELAYVTGSLHEDPQKIRVQNE